MSIDTLLEAARFLEWQAERDRTELAERHVEPRRLSREEDQCKATPPVDQKAESRQPEPLAPQPIGVGRGERPPCPAAPPPPAPIAVIPVMPVVAAPPAALPLAATARGSSPAPPPAPPHHVPRPPQVDTATRPVKCDQSPQPPIHVLYPPPASGDGAAAPQAPPASHLRTNGLVLDDMRGGANAKRRPGGAGTREVHNKLEQNRRAHLKECFETLKKNVPNVDDKKTSNLSVLRSALRYIQAGGRGRR